MVIGPKLIPNGSTDELSTDVWMHELHITNPTGGAITVTVQDRQAVPIVMVPGISLAAGGMISMDSAAGRAMLNGITWIASAPGLHGYIIGRIA